MEDFVKLLLFAGAVIIAGYSIHFYIDRKSKHSIAFFIILATCASLSVVIFFPNFFIGMEISNMNLTTAQHYYSVITNIIFGFSASIGIGLSVMSTSRGKKWSYGNSILFLVILVYFVIVMYFVYLLELTQRIAFLNN